MTLTIDTTLTVAQINRLLQIEERDPGAKIVDWDFQGGGPKIVFSDGRIRAINPSGRLLQRLLEEKEQRMAA